MAINNKHYTDLLMLTTLEVSEFCINMDKYFKKNNMQPQNFNEKIIDVAYTQGKINEALSKHIFVVDTSQKVSDIDTLKLKYFKSSFDEFKSDIYKGTINKKPISKSAAHYSSNQINYYLFFQMARDFTNKFDEVIDNWNKSYTPIIEKKLLNDLIESAPEPDKTKTKNKV